MNPIFGSALQMGLSPRSGLANAMAHAHAQNQLANQTAFRNGLDQLQNAYPQMHTPEASRERTPEEIQAQLEARYAEMEAEAERMVKRCSGCQWSEGIMCLQPLVVGFKRHRPNYDHIDFGGAALCGPEKALWEQKLTRWQKFMQWMHHMIDRLEAPLA